ncbi:TPA: IS66 family insertion sequence element accessory protein TnpB [Streptococcus suis]|nr:IS66 family insertion sequence element accessory protein TnpB [Streptococcus suis]HEL2384139.1 IS66 family insertion sequence element accessory protein TnpB [Streptococcus suis]
MTIRLSDLGQVYLVCGKTDMRQGIDSLAYLVKSQFNMDPFSGQVYLFCGGRKDRFKALYWDGQGFWLLYKRFENGKLTWPTNEEEVKALTSEQVDWLMKGFSIYFVIGRSRNTSYTYFFGQNSS